jgi:cob(I)alamin adenosyltransferase
MGQVDELNSVIGLLLAEDMPDPIRNALTRIQHDLFDLGGELCMPGTSTIGEAQITRLEALVEQFNEDLLPLKDFILPGGTRPLLSRIWRAPSVVAPSARSFIWRRPSRSPTLRASI